MIYRKIIRLAPLLFIPLMMISCSKEEGGGCITSSGPLVYEERSIGPVIDTLIIRGEFIVELSQGAVSRLYLQTGANLMPGIYTRQQHHKLVIEDANICDFLRDMGIKTRVFITLGKVKMIEFTGSGKLYSTDTLKLDSLRLESRDGAGTINLRLISQKTWLVQHSGTGAVDFNISGISDYTFIYCKGYAPFDCRNLFTPGYCHIVHMGSNNCYVHSDGILQAEIWSRGDIYYRGAPHTLWLRGDGKGRLLHLNP